MNLQRTQNMFYVPGNLYCRGRSYSRQELALPEHARDQALDLANRIVHEQGTKTIKRQADDNEPPTLFLRGLRIFNMFAGASLSPHNINFRSEDSSSQKLEELLELDPRNLLRRGLGVAKDESGENVQALLERM